MGLFNLFKSNLASKPAFSPEQSAMMRQRIGKNDFHGIMDYCLEQQVDLERPMADGDTVLAFAMKKMRGDMARWMAACDAFDARHEPLSVVLDEMNRRRETIHDPALQKAAALLSHETFLDELDIPQESRPAIVLTDAVFAQLDQAKNETRHNHLELSKGLYLAQMLHHYQAAHFGVSNESEEERIAMEKTATAYNGYLPLSKQIHDKLDQLDAYRKQAVARPSAVQFVAYMKDRDIRENFDWMQHYQPGENTFLKTFDRFRGVCKQFCANGSNALGYEYLVAHRHYGKTVKDDRRDKVCDLNDIGYYDWQPQRLTPAKAQYIARQNKTVIQAAAKETSHDMPYAMTAPINAPRPQWR